MAVVEFAWDGRVVGKDRAEKMGVEFVWDGSNGKGVRSRGVGSK